MKITRGYFNRYRISDSNVITESYRRTRYFSSTGIRSGAGTTVFISHKHSSHIQSEGLNMQREFNDGENIETSDYLVVGDSVGNTCLCGVA